MKHGYVAAICVGLVATSIVAQPALADTTTTVVSGTLALPNGTPISGLTVTLEAWPNATDLKALAVGAAVDTYTAGADVTGPNGEYSISLDDPAQLAAFADQTGSVNFVVQAAIGDSAVTYDLSRKLASISPAAAATVAPLQLSAEQVTAQSASPTQDSSTDASIASAGQVGCGWVYLQNLGPKWVQVGEAYTTTGTSASFNYSSSASSQLGVAVSSSGNAGTWSASGTNSVSSSSSVGMPAVSGASGRLWKTQFNYGKFGYTCSGSGTYQSYQTKATSFAAGSTWSTPASPPAASYCTTFSAGSNFVKNSTTATTFAAGAAVGLGINLSAQTGFSTSTALTFSFQATHKLCGSNAYPGNSPARLVAKP